MAPSVQKADMTRFIGRAESVSVTVARQLLNAAACRSSPGSSLARFSGRKSGAAETFPGRFLERLAGLWFSLSSVSALSTSFGCFSGSCSEVSIASIASSVVEVAAVVFSRRAAEE